MTLDQITRIKRWQVAHKQRSPAEYHAFDAVLTVWLMGWLGVPAALLLWQPDAVILAVLACHAPALYGRLRARLHRQARLRCDWIDLLAHSAAKPLRAEVE